MQTSCRPMFGLVPRHRLQLGLILQRCSANAGRKQTGFCSRTGPTQRGNHTPEPALNGCCSHHFDGCCCNCWLQDTIKFFFRGGEYSMADILPQRFGPANLLTDPDPPLLLQPQHHTLELTAGALPALKAALMCVMARCVCLGSHLLTGATTCPFRLGLKLSTGLGGARMYAVPSALVCAACGPADARQVLSAEQ